jgi:hypothetical protein
MKLNKKWIGAAIVFVIILVALRMFTREGYTLSPTQQESLTNMMTSRRLTQAEQTIIQDSIRQTAKPGDLLALPNFINPIFGKYPGLQGDINNIINPANPPTKPAPTGPTTPMGVVQQMMGSNYTGFECRAK